MSRKILVIFMATGGGWGEVLKINFLRKKIFAGKFILTPPLFEPPRYGPAFKHVDFFFTRS